MATNTRSFQRKNTICLITTSKTTYSQPSHPSLLTQKQSLKALFLNIIQDIHKVNDVNKVNMHFYKKRTRNDRTNTR